MNAAELEATWKIKTIGSDGIERTIIKSGAELFNMARAQSKVTGLHLRANASIAWVYVLLSVNASVSTRQRAYRNRVAPDGGMVFSDPVNAWEE